MNIKRFFIAFVVVFVLLELLNYILHGVLLMSEYEAMAKVFRPIEEMNSIMWLMYVVDIVWAFFFVFFFVKGYEERGIMEGIRYGIYVGLFISFVAAYAQYVIYPISHSVTLQWFLYGILQMIILGIATALIYRPKLILSNETAL